MLKFDVQYAQTKTDQIAILNWFDQSVGQHNLDISKGLIYKNALLVSDEEHNFFNSNDYKTGNVAYNNQEYFDVNLKYDLLNDQLLILPKNQSQGIEIILDKNKTARFEIYDKNFVLLPKYKNEKIDFDQGFFEVRLANQNFILYTKHSKKVLQKIMDEGIRFIFTKEINFYLQKEKIFYLINSKNDIIKLFPNQKNQIKEYYKKNFYLKEQNKEFFMTNLFVSISNN